MLLFTIHTNASLNQPVYILDRDGTAVALDNGGLYRCALKRRKTDANPVFVFESGSGGDGTLEALNGLIDGAVRDYFLFSAEQTAIIDLTPGVYVADIIRLDSPEDWEAGFYVDVDEGVSAQ
jgi:hypothetical protein